MPDSKDIVLQKLFIYDPAYSRSLSDIYIGKSAEPSRLFQKLILLLEFPRRSGADAALVDTIVRTAVKAFEEARQITPELVLENTLKAVNMLLPTIVPKKNPRWLEDLNLLIGVSDRGQVHFSQIGSMLTFLAQGSSLQLVSEDTGAINPLKVFSQVTSGLLNPGDALIMTTPALIDYIAEDKIRSIILRYPPDAAVRELEALVAQAPASVTFAAVIVKFTTEYDELAVRGLSEKQAVQKQATASAARSLDAEYEEYMPSPVDDLPRPRRSIRGDRARHQGGFSLRVLARWFFRFMWIYLVLIAQILRRMFEALVKTLQAMLFPDARARHEQGILSYSEHLIAQFQERMALYSKKTRILVFVTAILCFVLLHMLLITGQTQELKTIQTTYEDTLFSLTQQKQAVDDALLYKDESRAEQILVSMIVSLDAIRPLNKAQEDQIAQYRKETERELNKVRHINIIDSPLVFSDLSSITESKVQSFALLTDGALALAADTAVYRLKDTSLEKQSTLPSPAAFLAADGTAVLAISADQTITRIRGTETSPVTFPKHSDLRSIDAATLYAGNFYILDRAAGKIFKHEGSSANFRAGTVWLDDPGLLAKTNNAAIDGNVYLTTTDGDIVKLLKGARQEFDYHQFNPRLGSRATIYTTKESNLLYLLDPDNRRIAILDKQGNIKDQFTSDKFDALTALATNAAEDSLYVLNGKMIYLLAIKK